MKDWRRRLYILLCGFISEVIDQLVLSRFQVCPQCKKRTLLIRSVRAPLSLDKTLMLDIFPDQHLVHRADCVSCGYQSAASPLTR